MARSERYEQQLLSFSGLCKMVGQQKQSFDLTKMTVSKKWMVSTSSSYDY